MAKDGEIAPELQGDTGTGGRRITPILKHHLHKVAHALIEAH